MKILLTAIVKDDTEYDLFERMLGSFMPHMDGLAVAITGLSAPEGTKKIAQLVRKYKGEYVITSPETHPEIYTKGKDGYFFSNFAGARNAAFKLARKMQEKGKYDWWSWADTDDVLIAGDELKNIAGQAEGMDWVHFVYWYSVQTNPDGSIRVDEAGNPNIEVEHSRERLLSPKIEWKWVSRLHEIALPVDTAFEPKGVRVEYNPVKGGSRTVWCHLPPPGHYEPNLKRNVKILEIQAKEEDHKDPRTLFYLAKCYIDLSEKKNDTSLLQLAKLLLDDYLKASGWAEERSFAYQYEGMIALRNKDLNKAKEYYHQAIIEHPISHLPYLWLAHVYMTQNMDEEAEHWLDVAMKLPPPSSRSTIGSPLEIKLLVCKLKYNQAMKKLDLPTAILYKQRWNELENKDDGVLSQLLEIKESNDAAVWLHNYAIYLKNKGYKDQLKHLLSAMAPEFRNEYFAQKLTKDVIEPTVWPKGIVYLAASQFAPFNPKTAMQDGVGGSETAVIKLSEEWAKTRPVTVYANVTDDCVHNGVTYRHWNQFNVADTFDILILWRNPAALDQPLKARKILVDLHDITSNVEMTAERIAKVDKFMVKSEYHRSNIPSVPDEKIEIISNGI